MHGRQIAAITNARRHDYQNNGSFTARNEGLRLIRFEVNVFKLILITKVLV